MLLALQSYCWRASLVYLMIVIVELKVSLGSENSID
jgi:hypothetical protein